MIAGVWVLVLLPLVDALQARGWATDIPVPSIFDLRGPLTLNDTFIFGWGWGLGVYQPLVFCIGVVLLFSKEQGRRRGKLDWTRRWGVLCSYVVLLLSASQILYICALVFAGIAACFISIPLKYQPHSIQFFIEVSTACLRYGPSPMIGAAIVLVAFSSITILLACIPLFDALRSSSRCPR